MTSTHPIRGSIIPLFVLACLLLGGSTRSAWPNMLLQLGGIAILAWAALAAPRVQAGEPGRNLVRLAVAMLVVMLLQLVPMPPGLWTILPGRAAVANGYDLLGQPRPWLPLSLTPYDTMTSALWLIPPFAVLAGMLRLGAYREPWLAAALGIAALGGVLLGAMQVSSGDVLTSAWYLYAITNNGQAAGFFANSNHMGTLLICTVPFMVAMIEAPQRRSRRAQNDAGRLAIVGGVMAILLIGIALNHSLAAVGLSIPVVAASLLIRTPLSDKRARWGLGAAALIGVAAVIGVFASPIPNNLTAAGSAKDYSSRYASFGNSIEAAVDAFPFGTGSGSFPSVYPAYENADLVDAFFVNHTHNDYIELAMETGLPGILLMVATLLWWVGRSIAIWRAPIVDQFARAATIASGAILAHSMVDFPLRTSAIAAVFAMCLALMAGPRRRVRIDEAVRDGEVAGARHLSVD